MTKVLLVSQFCKTGILSPGVLLNVVKDFQPHCLAKKAGYCLHHGHYRQGHVLLV